ncbi:MAG: DNA adenine methylase [Lachnospiraceae bacterium]|nr:DNA adenine methylase [Lachnospiraceae bacterium]
MKAVIKYPGSKWSIAEWIISFFPEHHSYLEAFFGSGAVLFNKPRSNIETVNDLDGNVVNLFEWIRKDPEQLAREIYLTPYARQVYDEAFSAVPEDSLQKAVNFYIRLNMGHGFRTTGEKVGWKNDVQGRERAYAATDWVNLPDKIMQAAERLRGVQIENRPAVELIERFNYPNVLIYADPPYVLGTRHGKQYRCEMEDKDQNDLLDVLLVHKGLVLLSGYDNDLYNDRLKGWHREETTCYSQVNSKKREILWMNFEPARQMNLFNLTEVMP